MVNSHPTLQGHHPFNEQWQYKMVWRMSQAKCGAAKLNWALLAGELACQVDGPQRAAQAAADDEEEAAEDNQKSG